MLLRLDLQGLLSKLPLVCVHVTLQCVDLCFIKSLSPCLFNGPETCTAAWRSIGHFDQKNPAQMFGVFLHIAVGDSVSVIFIVFTGVCLPLTVFWLHCFLNNCPLQWASAGWTKSIVSVAQRVHEVAPLSMLTPLTAWTTASTAAPAKIHIMSTTHCAIRRRNVHVSTWASPTAQGQLSHSNAAHGMCYFFLPSSPQTLLPSLFS